MLHHCQSEYRRSKSVSKKEIEMKKNLVFLLSVLVLIGCHRNDGAAEQPHTSGIEPSSEVSEVIRNQEDESKIVPREEESIADDVNRPVITHKADVIYFDKGQSFHDYSENVLSVVDVEDGDIPYEFIGGFDGPYTDEELYDLTHQTENPRIAESKLHGMYATFGGKFDSNEYGEESICVTNAFDSEGHASWKEYTIIYLEVDENSAIGMAEIKVESLNVRDQPSISGTKMGQVVIDKTYLVYETIVADGYTWYRIAKDLWIADDGDGTWISFH